MAKISASECFDEVITQAGTLTQVTDLKARADAVKRLCEIAAATESTGGEAAAILSKIAAFPQEQKKWDDASMQRYSSYLKEELPRLREALGMPKTNLADLIWKSAEILTGAFKPAEYRKVILPLMVLRRLDCLLLPTKDAVLDKYAEIKPKGFDPSLFLGKITGYPFWNTSPFTLAKLVQSPDELAANIEEMINRFSPNVRRISMHIPLLSWSCMKSIDQT